jgi:FtsH-binding integral membrane protein
LFLVVAAAFLSDTWLATVDAVSRTHADCVYGFFPGSHRISYRKWYLIFLLLLTLVTGITVQMNEPGTLILISAVIGFVGTVLYSVALVLLNHIYLPRHLPSAAKPGRVSFYLLLLSCTAYFVLAMLYVLSTLEAI